MKKLIATVILSILLVGCSGELGLQPIKTKSAYDGKNEISIVPHGAQCCLAVGAYWSEVSPGTVILPIKIFGNYTNIESAKFLIDGKEYVLSEAQDYTQFSLNGNQLLPAGTPLTPESTKGFVTNLSMVKSILSSKKTSISVSTISDGPVSSVINDGEMKSKAYFALDRFIKALP